MRNTRKKANKMLYFIALTFLTFAMVILFSSFRTDAAGSVTVTKIDYENSTITLKANSGDTAIYFSDSSQKKWIQIPGKISGGEITMDISWISLTKDYVITFKGNSSTVVTSVTIPKQVTNFKASFNKVKGTVVFTNTSGRTIEWRKKESSIWTEVPTANGQIDDAKLSENLGYLYTKGATIYFRLAPINGTGSSSHGARASKETSVTIPKKTAAPNVAINGSKFIIPVKSGTAYRYVDEDGNAVGGGTWTINRSTTDLKLSNVASKAMYNDGSTIQEKVYLQFRTNATSSSQVSLTKTLMIPIQEGKPDTDTYGINFAYTSSTTLSLTVAAASSTQPFEYTIIDKGESLNYITATWTPITSSTAISINNKIAKEGSHIYIRKQSIPQSETEEFKLASMEIDVTGTDGVKYPEAAKADTLYKFITTAGVCNTSSTGANYQFTLYSRTESTVSAITFKNIYGNTVGTVTCKSTVATNSSPKADKSDAYIITTTITSTAGIDSKTEEQLFADITLKNKTTGDTETITSTTTSGVMMYLYPASKFNNPEDDDKDDAGIKYLQTFDRVFQSNNTDDDKSFTFVIDFGKEFALDKTKNEINAFTSNKLAIDSIVFDNYTLKNGTDYTVTAGSYVDANNNNKTVYTAKVVVNVSEFESESLITTRDTDKPLMIKLNNGEVIDDVTINLVQTASIDKAPVAWSIIEGSLKETETSTTYDSTGKAVTKETEVITYTMTLSIFNKSYGVSVADVTWGGTSILRSAEVSGGVITINLSNAKINALQTDSTTTNNLTIKLSNGFTITKGCKLTILNSN